VAEHTDRDAIIVGQGLAGSSLAWQLHLRGFTLCVIDPAEEVTSSRVAAGLITPITGKRFVQAAEFTEHWSAANTFYRTVEQIVDAQFFTEQGIVRLFKDDADREYFLTRKYDRYRETVELQYDEEGTATGIRMLGARLDSRAFLAATRSFFDARGDLQERRISGVEEFEPTAERVRYANGSIEAQAVIWCTGFEQQHSEPFPEVPDSPCRGDILRVRIPEFVSQDVQNCGVWLAPEPDGTFLAGSTYDWTDLTNTPRSSGRSRILSQLGKFIRQPIEVVDHQAAVRPAMKNARPVWYQHAEQPRYAVLNGLGARGALWAPLQADQLIDHLLQNQILPAKDKSHR